jgi:osmotically-inducible protein OsmY
MKTDRILQEDTLRALEFDPLNAASIGVTVANGVVTLHGRVGSTVERETAERLALDVPGVRAVANELAVGNDAALASQPSDAVIAQAAANALLWYRAVPSETVHVAVHDGCITLTGTVRTIAERGAAERAVRNLRGVRRVTNAITVLAPIAMDARPAALTA